MTKSKPLDTIALGVRLQTAEYALQAALILVTEAETPPKWLASVRSAIRDVHWLMDRCEKEQRNIS